MFPHRRHWRCPPLRDRPVWSRNKLFDSLNDVVLPLARRGAPMLVRKLTGNIPLIIRAFSAERFALAIVKYVWSFRGSLGWLEMPWQDEVLSEVKGNFGLAKWLLEQGARVTHDSLCGAACCYPHQGLRERLAVFDLFAEEMSPDAGVLVRAAWAVDSKEIIAHIVRKHLSPDARLGVVLEAIGRSSMPWMIAMAPCVSAMITPAVIRTHFGDSERPAPKRSAHARASRLKLHFAASGTRRCMQSPERYKGELHAIEEVAVWLCGAGERICPAGTLRDVPETLQKYRQAYKPWHPLLQWCQPTAFRALCGQCCYAKRLDKGPLRMPPEMEAHPVVDSARAERGCAGC